MVLPSTRQCMCSIPCGCISKGVSFLLPIVNYYLKELCNTIIKIKGVTGEVVRIHGADLYRYCAVHHSDSLKNAITCKWSFFVHSFNVNGTLVTNGKWFHRCVTTWQSLFSRSITSVLPRAFVEGFPMECDRF